MRRLTVRKPYPQQLIVDIHSYCNAECNICPYSFLKTRNPMGVMDEALFRKIIDDFSELSRKHDFPGQVVFCNMGEIFVYPQTAVKRIGYVVQSGLAFHIQTNASRLYPDVVDALKASGFSGSVTISCHGISPEVYHRSMGLDISTTLQNIDYLVRQYPGGKIGIQSIPYRWPRGEAKRVRSYFHQKGIPVRMPLPNNRAGLLREIAVISKKRLIGCAAGRPLGEMVISFDGAVVLCCNDMGREEIVGDVKQHTIEEVWNGEAMSRLLGKIYDGDPSPDGFICKRCEFGITSGSLLNRLAKNVRYEGKKFFFTYLR